ncbi:MAG: thiamine pyrophosphate-binding protein, partial [Chloroflexi bacterium]|nr:thiamine pyrophosphate-binding protein [Chloroflexota bacterium]
MHPQPDQEPVAQDVADAAEAGQEPSEPVESAAADRGQVEPAEAVVPAEAAEPEPELSDAEPEPDAQVAEPHEAVVAEARPELSDAEPEPDAQVAEPHEAAEPEPEPDAQVVEPEPNPEPEPAAPRTVAELIAATLRGAGVRLAFTVPGESFLPVLDALEAAGIRIVATRHEGAAAFAAEAYGQLTGRPAACLGTRIVGAANLAIGIHTATADSSPMFALVGQVERHLRGREAFQEADLVNTIGSLAKWAGEIDDPETAATVLEDAVRAVLEGRPGPALLALPEDVLSLPIPEGTRVPIIRSHPETPSVDDIRAVLHFLAAAERPVIIAGAGVLRARCSNDLVRFAELLHVPVIASWRRGDVIPNDHSLYLGMTGYGSPNTVRARLEAADAILVLGARLSEPTSYEYAIPAPGQPWMHVDLEPRTGELGVTSTPVLAIRADARSFLRAAVARLKDGVLAAEPLAARDRNNAEDRSAWEASTVV